MDRMTLTLLLVLLAVAEPIGQASTVQTFEAASIKRTPSDTSGSGFQFAPGGRFVMTNAPISGLILTAYPTATGELVGAPDWLTADRYDVTAKAEGDPPREAMRAMLQTLLRERLQFRAHYEDQERPVYFLTRARTDGRLGPQLRETTLDCDAIQRAMRQGERPETRESNDRPVCGTRVSGTRFTANGDSLEVLTSTLRARAGRVVIDKTGLAGRYDFVLEFAARPDDSDRPSIFTALEEQLGLRLESGRAPVQVLVIDHVERPTAD